MSRGEGGGGMAGEERMDVSIYIQCNNKKKPFVRIDMMAHPHPCALAFLSLPNLPFMSSCTGVMLMCLCLVGTGGNTWEAPNTKNVPTMAGFLHLEGGGKRTGKMCPEWHILHFWLAGKGWPWVSNRRWGEWLGMGGRVSVR